MATGHNYAVAMDRGGEVAAPRTALLNHVVLGPTDVGVKESFAAHDVRLPSRGMTTRRSRRGSLTESPTAINRNAPHPMAELCETRSDHVVEYFSAFLFFCDIRKVVVAFDRECRYVSDMVNTHTPTGVINHISRRNTLLLAGTNV